MRLPPNWELPDEIRHRMGERGGQQRALAAAGHLLLVLHKVPNPATAERENAFFWRQPDGDWLMAGGGGLIHLKQHIEAYNNAVERLTKDYANATESTDYFRVLEAAVPLHRAAHNMHLTLESAREKIPKAHEIVSLRDAAADVDRASELLAIDARNALDYKIARQGEEQAKLSLELAKSGHRLNVIAAIFLPLTALASVFGMALPSGLEHSPPIVFWAVFAAGILLGIGIQFFLFRGRNER